MCASKPLGILVWKRNSSLGEVIWIALLEFSLLQLKAREGGCEVGLCFNFPCLQFWIACFVPREERIFLPPGSTPMWSWESSLDERNFFASWTAVTTPLHWEHSGYREGFPWKTGIFKKHVLVYSLGSVYFHVKLCYVTCVYVKEVYFLRSVLLLEGGPQGTWLKQLRAHIWSSWGESEKLQTSNANVCREVVTFSGLEKASRSVCYTCFYPDQPVSGN